MLKLKKFLVLLLLLTNVSIFAMEKQTKGKQKEVAGPKIEGNNIQDFAQYAHQRNLFFSKLPDELNTHIGNFVETNGFNPGNNVHWSLATFSNPTNIFQNRLKHTQCVATLKDDECDVTCSTKLDNTTFASGSRVGTVTVWSKKEDGSYKKIATLKDHKCEVICLTKLDDTTFASGSWDGTAIVWGKKEDGSYKKIATLKDHADWVMSLMKLDDTIFASVTDDKTIKLWTIPTVKECIAQAKFEATLECPICLCKGAEIKEDNRSSNNGLL